MKKQLLLGVALFGAAAAVNSSALAASPIYNWTGCYIGVNAGYSWGHASADSTASGLATSTSLRPNGFIGGGQVGCNWLYNNAVWGLETDFQGSAERDNRFTVPFSTGEGSITQNIEARLRWFGTVRARAGVLVVPTVLLYGTGGLAYGNVNVTDTISVSGVGSSSFSASSTRVGWTVGVGVESLIPNAPGWTWKIEYLYMELGSTSGNAIDPLGGAVSWNARFTDNIVRVGVNYKFTP